MTDRAQSVRLVATDLDGTLLSPDGTVSRENRDAILAAAERGVPVVAATGRPARWLEVLNDVEGLHPVVVALAVLVVILLLAGALSVMPAQAGLV